MMLLLYWLMAIQITFVFDVAFFFFECKVWCFLTMYLKVCMASQIDFVFLHLLRTGKYRTLKVWFCHLSTETPINKATQFFQKVNKIFRKNPARSGLQTVSQRENLSEVRLKVKKQVKVCRNYANKVCETRKLVKKLVKLS